MKVAFFRFRLERVDPMIWLVVFFPVVGGEQTVLANTIFACANTKSAIRNSSNVEATNLLAPHTHKPFDTDKQAPQVNISKMLGLRMEINSFLFYIFFVRSVFVLRAGNWITHEMKLSLSLNLDGNENENASIHTHTHQAHTSTQNKSTQT